MAILQTMCLIPDNPVSTWSDYLAATLDKPLHPLFLILEPHLPPTGRAFDLGCGVGHAVIWLAQKGWQVMAVDGNDEALRIVESRIDDRTRPLVELNLSRIEDVELPPAQFDLGIAAYSLFFLESRAAFDAAWRKIERAVKPGGLFVGEFLGPNDDWAGERLFHTAQEVRDLLANWEILHWEEAEQDGHTSLGTAKHWHVFHVIAQRRV